MSSSQHPSIAQWDPKLREQNDSAILSLYSLAVTILQTNDAYIKILPMKQILRSDWGVSNWKLAGFYWKCIQHAF